jgi:hypothetical protein
LASSKGAELRETAASKIKGEMRIAVRAGSSHRRKEGKTRGRLGSVTATTK